MKFRISIMLCLSLFLGLLGIVTEPAFALAKGRMYIRDLKSATWLEARQNCERMQTHLATLSDLDHLREQLWRTAHWPRLFPSRPCLITFDLDSPQNDPDPKMISLDDLHPFLFWTDTIQHSLFGQPYAYSFETGKAINSINLDDEPLPYLCVQDPDQLSLIQRKELRIQ